MALIRKINKEEKWSFINTVVGIIGNSLILFLFAEFVNEREIALWYLYASIWGIFAILQGGFFNILSRHISYILGGKESYKFFDVHQFVSANVVVFSWIATIISISTLLIGTIYLFFFNGVKMHSDDLISWLLYIISSVLLLLVLLQYAILVGFGQLALTQKYNVISIFVNILLVCITFFLLEWHNLFNFVVCYLISRLFNYYLSSRALKTFYILPKRKQGDYKQMRDIVLKDMKKFVFGLLSISIQTSLFMLVISHYSSVSFIASYGFTMQVINYIISFSAIFISSNLPTFYRLYAESNFKGLNLLFKKKWLMSVCSFGFCIIFFSLLFPLLAEWLQLNVSILSGFCLLSLMLCVFVEFSVGQLTQYLGCCNELRLIPLNFPLSIIVIIFTLMFCIFKMDISYIFLLRGFLYCCIMLFPTIFLIKKINKKKI